MSVHAVPAINGPASLPNWTVNRDYPGTAITATAGTTPYAWSATGLPAGLAIDSSTGVVTGTPGATGTFTATVTLTDVSGTTASRGYTVTINAAPIITGPATLPNWTAGSAYPAQTMTAANGTPAYTWIAGGLPTGLSINSTTGVISGTPNSAGTYSVNITATDSAGATGTPRVLRDDQPGPGHRNRQRW